MKNAVNKFVSYLKNVFNTNGKSRFSLFVYCAICVSAFVTMIMQSPFFVEKGLNSFFAIFWIVVLALSIILNYKRFLDILFVLIIISIPFLLYSFIGKMAVGNSLINELFRCLLISFAIYIIGNIYSPYLTEEKFNFLLLTFVSGLVVTCIIIFFTKIVGSNLDSNVYAYGSKNSTGPLLVASSLICLYLSKKFKSTKFVFYLISAFFCIFVFLIKCRAAIVSIPVLWVYILLEICIKKKEKMLFAGLTLVALILLFCIAPLRELLINKIILNASTGLNNISSGRISLISEELSKANLIIGTSGSYVDCFPVCILINYGFIGTILFTPFIVFPFIAINKINLRSFRFFAFMLMITYFINGFFEGYGYIGTGVKVLPLWLIIGLLANNFPVSKREFKVLEFLKQKDNFINACQALGVLLICVFTSQSLFEKLSLAIYKKVPNFSKTEITYVEADSVKINGPEILCTGQKMHYNLDIFPENATDKGANWEIWGNTEGVYAFDDITGEIKALKECGGFTLRASHGKNYSISDRIIIKTISPNDYSFSNFQIYSNKNNSNEIKVNENLRICYSRDYVPDSVRVTYFSSNNKITISDKGIITALEEGDVTVFAKIENNAGTFVSNELSFSIKGTMDAEKKIDVSKIGNTVFYENNEYNFNNLLGIDDSADSFAIIVDDCIIDNGSFTFSKAGTHRIVVIDSKDKVVLNKEITVLENKLVGFLYKGPYIVQLGKNDIQLYTKFENGFERKAISSDFVHHNERKELRSWHSKNGLSDDLLHFDAVKVGNCSFNYVSTIDSKINLSIKLTVTDLDPSSYIRNSKVLGISIFAILSILLIVFSFNLSNGRRILISNIALGVGSIGVLTVISALNNLMVASGIVVLSLTLIFMVLFSLFGILKNIRLNVLNIERIDDDGYMLKPKRFNIIIE